MKQRKRIRGVFVASATPIGKMVINEKRGDKPTSLIVQKPLNRATAND
jgi:hypothetical protein